VLYTCNKDECIEAAEIARANLKAIGIDLDIRRFTFGDMFARITDTELDEPFDISVWGWIGDTPDPSEFTDAMFGLFPTSTGFLAGTRLGERLRAAGRLTGAARMEAYARLDRDLIARAAPFVPAVSATRADFFSARVGCQVEHPLYGIDLGALCIPSRR
jgi:ABC-type oligopeptide transport system substrate-binding subunit